MTTRDKILSVIVLLLIITIIELPAIITAIFPAPRIRQMSINDLERGYKQKIQLLEKEIQRLKFDCNDVNQGK